MSYGQVWEYSNAIKGSNIKPLYSSSDGNNNYFVFSEFTGSLFIDGDTLISSGMKDLLVSKFDNRGELVNYIQIQSTDNLSPGGMALYNSNVYITGTFSGTVIFPDNSILSTGGQKNIFLITTDNNLQLTGEPHNIGQTSGNAFSKDLQIDENGNTILCGIYKGDLTINTGSDIKTVPGSSIFYSFITKISSSLNIEWLNSVPSNNTSSRIVKIATSNTGYYFGGSLVGTMNFDTGDKTSMNGSFDNFIYKTDLDGSGEWVRVVSGTGSENFSALKTDPYNNVYLLGNYESSILVVDSTATTTSSINQNEGGWDTYIVKYNRSGILQWSITKGGTLLDLYNDMAINGDIMYVTGTIDGHIVI